MSQNPSTNRPSTPPLDFAGIGLHSGAEVTLRLVPAPAGSGIVFRRTDLDNYEIPAIGRNVAKVSYATSLDARRACSSPPPSTCCPRSIGLGVDNVIVEVDNLEVPILDGSARPYVDAILDVGLKRAAAANASISASSRMSKCAKATSSSASTPAKATPSTT